MIQQIFLFPEILQNLIIFSKQLAEKWEGVNNAKKNIFFFKSNKKKDTDTFSYWSILN